MPVPKKFTVKTGILDKGKVVYVIPNMGTLKPKLPKSTLIAYHILIFAYHGLLLQRLASP